MNFRCTYTTLLTSNTEHDGRVENEVEHVSNEGLLLHEDPRDKTNDDASRQLKKASPKK